MFLEENLIPMLREEPCSRRYPKTKLCDTWRRMAIFFCPQLTFVPTYLPWVQAKQLFLHIHPMYFNLLRFSNSPRWVLRRAEDVKTLVCSVNVCCPCQTLFLSIHLSWSSLVPEPWVLKAFLFEGTSRPETANLLL